MDIERIDPEQAREEMERGALLVCAYDDPEKFHQYQLEGALSLDELRAREDALAKERELIFYCA